MIKLFTILMFFTPFTVVANSVLDNHLKEQLTGQTDTGKRFVAWLEFIEAGGLFPGKKKSEIFALDTNFEKFGDNGDIILSFEAPLQAAFKTFGESVKGAEDSRWRLFVSFDENGFLTKFYIDLIFFDRKYPQKKFKF